LEAAGTPAKKANEKKSEKSVKTRVRHIKPKRHTRDICGFLKPKSKKNKVGRAGSKNARRIISFTQRNTWAQASILLERGKLVGNLMNGDDASDRRGEWAGLVSCRRTCSKIRKENNKNREEHSLKRKRTRKESIKGYDRSPGGE